MAAAVTEVSLPAETTLLRAEEPADALFICFSPHAVLHVLRATWLRNALGGFL